MKNSKFLVAVVLFVLMLGFTTISCSDEVSPVDVNLIDVPMTDGDPLDTGVVIGL
jgi:hypothetical protein